MICVCGREDLPEVILVPGGHDAFCGKAGNLTWAIWWLAGMEKSNPIRLTKRVLREFHISPRSARRLLNDFEQAGLLHVDRKRGRGPDITLLEPEPPIDENE